MERGHATPVDLMRDELIQHGKLACARCNDDGGMAELLDRLCNSFRTLRRGTFTQNVAVLVHL
jgi:hypothetical protein